LIDGFAIELKTPGFQIVDHGTIQQDHIAVASNSNLTDVERPGTTSMANSSREPEEELRNPIEEKEEAGNASISKEIEAVATEALVQDVGEYPRGTSLFFIVVALFLSVFLICLDMVGNT
jgi:hypothetical protein